MPRKKKYENAEIVKQIITRECNYYGDMKSCLVFKFIDFKKKQDRDFMRESINEMIVIFQDALKELEEKVDG